MRVSIARILRNVLLIMASIVILFVAAMLVSGAKAFAVESDSMAPLLRRGDVVFVRPTAFEKLMEGDVISARFPNSDGVFTHRIVEVDAENKQIITRGDGNVSNDPVPTDASRIIGKRWFSLPFLGFLSFSLEGKNMIFILLAVAIILVAVHMAGSFRRNTDS